MADADYEPAQRGSPGGVGTGGKFAIIAAVLLAILAVRWFKTQHTEPPTAPGSALTSTETRPGASPPGAAATAGAKLPRLVDLGATKCDACKKLAPILEELDREYAGRLTVQFIDVWENPRAGEEYGIRLIPTQIFYDALGKERFRHEGFISKEDILSKWKELGVELRSRPSASIVRESPAQPDARPRE